MWYEHDYQPREGAEHKPYCGTFSKLDQLDIEYFYNRFGIFAATSNAYIGVNESRYYVLPIYTPSGLIRGYNIRRGGWSGNFWPGNRQASVFPPKSQTYKNRAEDLLQSVYTFEEYSPTVVVVEDQISALKLWQSGLTSVALMGNVMNAAKVREISGLRPDEVVIALDADATNEAVAMARTWGLAFPKTRVALLERDIKDTDNEDIAYVLRL